MPFTGDTFAHLFDWVLDPQRQEKIVNARLEAEFDGIDTGLSTAAARISVLEGAANGDVSGPAVATDHAAARFDLTTGKLIQNSALIVADTTGDLSRSGGGGIDIEGTTTNDNAPSGYIGEVIESNLTSGSAVSLTDNTAANVTSIALTAGDWDVWGNVFFQPTGATTITALDAVISTSSAGGVGGVNGGGAQGYITTFTTGFPNTMPAGFRRVLLSAPGTVYLVAKANFGASGMTAYGYIGARRAR